MNGLEIRERPSPNHDSRGDVIAGTHAAHTTGAAPMAAASRGSETS